MTEPGMLPNRVVIIHPKPEGGTVESVFEAENIDAAIFLYLKLQNTSGVAMVRLRDAAGHDYKPVPQVGYTFVRASETRNVRYSDDRAKTIHEALFLSKESR